MMWSDRRMGSYSVNLSCVGKTKIQMKFYIHIQRITRNPHPNVQPTATCMYVYTHVYTCLFICACTYAYLCVFKCVCMCMHTCVYMNVCSCVWVREYTCVYTWLCVPLLMHTLVRTIVTTCTHVCESVCGVQTLRCLCVTLYMCACVSSFYLSRCQKDLRFCLCFEIRYLVLTL